MAKVSVGLPTYNSEKFIRRSIGSLLNQTFQDFDIIVVDDGSQDQTFNILEEYKEELGDKIKIIRNEHNFMNTRNTIYKNCVDCDYIMNMDSDDFCDPTKIEKQVEFLDENPNIDVLGTAIRILVTNNDLTAVLKEYQYGYPEFHQDIERAFHYTNGTSFPSDMFRRECLDVFTNQVYFFPEFEEGGGDQQFNLILLYNGKKFHNLQEPLFLYTMRADSVSHKKGSCQFFKDLNYNKDKFLELNQIYNG